MAQTPLFLQSDYSECGPAALGIILSYYGCRPDLETLDVVCGLTEQGVTAGAILQAARGYGLLAQAQRHSLESLAAVPPPFIVFWDGRYFVVVEEVTPGRITLNDPACGHRTLSPAQFAQFFSGIVLRFEPGPNFQPFVAAPAGEPLIEKLREGVRGSVAWRPAQLAHYEQDFGRYYRRRPVAVVRAICEQDVIHTLQVARAAAIPLVTRGAGHARQGQTLSAGGIVLVNCVDYIAPVQLLADGLALIEGRSQWLAVERELNRLGRSVPTLPAYTRLSVGGTLSVGGYGERSVKYGSQVSQVRRLRLVLPDGRPVWCSPAENENLFRFALAGLGQVGVIEQVAMETVAHRPAGPPQRYHFSQLAHFLQMLAWLEGAEVEHFSAFLLKDHGLFAEMRFPAELSSPIDPPVSRPVAAIPAYRPQDAQISGYRLAADYLFSRDGLAAAVEQLNQLWQTTDLGRYADWVLVLAVRPGARLPFEAGLDDPAGLQFLLGLYPCIELDDPAGLELVRAIFRQLLATCLAWGGRPYLYGFHQLDEATKTKLYGQAYRHLTQLRQELDPQGLFNQVF